MSISIGNWLLAHKIDRFFLSWFRNRMDERPKKIFVPEQIEFFNKDCVDNNNNYRTDSQIVHQIGFA